MSVPVNQEDLDLDLAMAISLQEEEEAAAAAEARAAATGGGSYEYYSSHSGAPQSSSGRGPSPFHPSHYLYQSTGGNGNVNNNMGPATTVTAVPVHPSSPYSPSSSSGRSFRGPTVVATPVPDNYQEYSYDPEELRQQQQYYNAYNNQSRQQQVPQQQQQQRFYLSRNDPSTGAELAITQPPSRGSNNGLISSNTYAMTEAPGNSGQGLTFVTWAKRGILLVVGVIVIVLVIKYFRR